MRDESGIADTQLDIVVDNGGIELHGTFLRLHRKRRVVELVDLGVVIYEARLPNDTVDLADRRLQVFSAKGLHRSYRLAILFSKPDTCYVGNRYIGLERIAVHHHAVLQVLRRQRRSLAPSSDIVAEFTPSGSRSIEFFGAFRHQQRQRLIRHSEHRVAERSVGYDRRNSQTAFHLGIAILIDSLAVPERAVHLAYGNGNIEITDVVAHAAGLHLDQCLRPTGIGRIQTDEQRGLALVVDIGIEVGGEIRIERIDGEDRRTTALVPTVEGRDGYLAHSGADTESVGTGAEIACVESRVFDHLQSVERRP